MLDLVSPTPCKAPKISRAVSPTPAAIATGAEATEAMRVAAKAGTDAPRP